MRTFPARLTISALGLFCFAASASAEKLTTIGVLQGAGTMRYHNRNRIVLTIQTVDGKNLLIGVENADEDKYVVAPKEVLLDEIKALSPGDMTKVVYYTQDDKTNLLDRITPYAMEPGMELPNAFVFHEAFDTSESKKSFTRVDMKRFEAPYTFMVFGKSDDGGNITADPDLMAKLGKLKDGQLVLVDATPGSPYPILRGVEVYTPPQTGTLKAIKISELNGNKTTEADIDVDGTVVTAFVPGKLDGKRWIVDSKILAEVRRLRPNTQVLFRVADDGSGNSVLREIKQAPKEPAKTAAPAGAAR